MFQMKDGMQTAVKHNIRGGEGSPSFRYLFSAEQLGGRAEMMAVITLQPGGSVRTRQTAKPTSFSRAPPPSPKTAPRGSSTWATQSSAPTATRIPSATTQTPSPAFWQSFCRTGKQTPKNEKPPRKPDLRGGKEETAL